MKITVCESRSLRKAVNMTRRYIRNDDFIRAVGTMPIMDFVGKQKLKWIGHLARKDPTVPAGRGYNMKIKTLKGRGRPRESWI